MKPGGSVTLLGDPDRLAQVVINLLGNAIHYNKPGGTVTLSASIEGAEAVLSVADTGVGIPPGELPLIFERSHQVERERSREYGGNGLGLAICKSLVEAHGGRIHVASKIGRGTIFSVWLPRRVR